MEVQTKNTCSAAQRRLHYHKASIIYSNAYKTHTYSLQLGQMQNDNCEKGVGIWNVGKATNNPFLLNGCDFGFEKK